MNGWCKPVLARISIIVYMILCWYFIELLYAWKNGYTYLTVYAFYFIYIKFDILFKPYFFHLMTIIPIFFYIYQLLLTKFLRSNKDRYKGSVLSAKFEKYGVGAKFWSSWETYHFFFKAQDASNKKLKKHYLKKFIEWRMFDRQIYKNNLKLKI